VKVVLNGQGADETAAGYPSYFTNYWHSLLRAGRLLHAWSEIASHSRSHRRPAGQVLLRQLQLLARSFLARSPAFRRLSSARAARGVRAHPWIVSDVAAQLAPIPDAIPDYGLRPVLAKSVHENPLPLYLRVEDRNSSAHSIELRVPFLDYRLVELLFGLPDNWCMRGPWNKYVQREGMRTRIPEPARVRMDKMGFPVPTRQWFAGPLYDSLRELLSSREMRERGIYRMDAVLADLYRHHRGEGMASDGLFDGAQFELWCRQSHTQSASAPAYPLPPNGALLK